MHACIEGAPQASVRKRVARIQVRFIHGCVTIAKTHLCLAWCKSNDCNCGDYSVLLYVRVENVQQG